MREHLRRDHCRHNDPTSKDVLTASEIQDISDLFFAKNASLPSKTNWGFGKEGDRFDSLIGGWTRYWNEVFAPDVPLDPDLGGKKRSAAKGLMQLLPATVRYFARATCALTKSCDICSSYRPRADTHFDPVGTILPMSLGTHTRRDRKIHTRVGAILAAPHRCFRNCLRAAMAWSGKSEKTPSTPASKNFRYSLMGSPA